MKRLALIAAMVTALMAVSAGRAEARLFEPQPHWWRSGAACLDSRAPPGLAWDDPAPRACVARSEPALVKVRANAPDAQAGYALASAEETLADKFVAKPAPSL